MSADGTGPVVSAFASLVHRTRPVMFRCPILAANGQVLAHHATLRNAPRGRLLGPATVTIDTCPLCGDPHEIPLSDQAIANCVRGGMFVDVHGPELHDPKRSYDPALWPALDAAAITTWAARLDTLTPADLIDLACTGRMLP